MTEIVKLRRSGNSAILTITKEILESLGWNLGDNVEISAKGEADTKYLEVRKIRYVRV